MKTGYKKVIFFSVFTVALISFAIFVGYLSGIHELPPYWFLRRAELNLFGNYFERVAAPPAPRYYDSILLRLYSEQANLNDQMTRAGRGGGLTSFGDAMLLLTHDGQIFAVRSADDITKTNIAVPENGFTAYQRAAESDAFKDLTHNFSLYRYNDILYYNSDSNRGLAISYTEFDSTGNCYRNAVATLPISPDIQSVYQLSAGSEDWDIIFRAHPCLPLKSIHNALEGGLAGGRMDFRAPSTIFLGSGDYHWDGMYAPEAIAQKPDYEFGKVIRINLDTRQSDIYASGIRNPQGVVLDSNDSLWIVEHGLRGGDELNLIEKGNNYGWPVETLGTQYSKLPVPGSTVETYGRHEDFQPPIFAWLPSVAISSITLIKNFADSWDGDLLMGSLKNMSLYHIRIKNNRVLFSERIEIGERIRYVHQHTDGRIVLWTDSHKLFFLTGQPYTDNYVTDYLEENVQNEDLRQKVKITIDACRQCHSIEPGENETAPSLASVYNTEIATTDYRNYSRALSTKQGRWTRENLRKFISNPEQFAPGTLMPDPGVRDNDVMEELINLLQAFNTKSPNPRGGN